MVSGGAPGIRQCPNPLGAGATVFDDAGVVALAQAGGRDTSQLPAALESAKQQLLEALS
ncbi:hypothetical protein [Nodosilinea sp. P-1105]|uniref:hypothetical protein n=1 Tax=Nodosilinea sp. P-1105 TaxID=2546229 RepID=UPI00146A2903|nr:hypothetical protein [Nodosilinea sp. P-1105]